MNIVIFAGGSGTRLWPISRKQYPKQFQPIINNKSTLELRVEQLTRKYDWSSIYFSTTETLVSLIKNIFPKVPTSNIITEPARRDLGPAVGLAMAHLQKMSAGKEPIAVIWGDSVTQNAGEFLRILEVGENRIKDNPKQLIWLGEKPKFANENVGWIHLGKEVGQEKGVKYYKPASFKYRPDLKTAEKWFKNGGYSINTGYFTTTPDFIMSKIKQTSPLLFKQLEEIKKDIGTKKENQTLQKIYRQIKSIHFDHIVLEHIKQNEALVIEGDLDWSDPGTLYALKQFLEEKHADNVNKGLVYNFDTQDSLVYNYVNKQLVATIGLEGFIVINTPDAILVCHKDDVRRISDMVKEFKGTELEELL